MIGRRLAALALALGLALCCHAKLEIGLGTPAPAPSLERAVAREAEAAAAEEEAGRLPHPIAAQMLTIAAQVLALLAAPAPDAIARALVVVRAARETLRPTPAEAPYAPFISTWLAQLEAALEAAH